MARGGRLYDVELNFRQGVGSPKKFTGDEGAQIM